MAHSWGGNSGARTGRPLGYEANGTRPTPFIGFYGVLPSQGRPSTASHHVQPIRPLPTASLLPFLLQPPEDGRGQQRSLPPLGVPVVAPGMRWIWLVPS